ncbi:MAG: hypothetical protein ACLFQX_11920 [Candidatus Kapaibacterium sp.]
MRISTNSIFTPYGRNLEELQRSQYEAQVRLSSGKDIISLSDSPKRAVNAKDFTEIINRNTQYIDNMERALGEMRVTHDSLESLSDNLHQIRILAIDSNQVSNSANLSNLGVYIRGLLDDVVKDANSDFNGKFLFGGTRTTPASVESGDTGHALPFELVEGDATAENPSGLSIRFKGNDSARLIDKDAHSTEKINATASEIFGEGGTEILETIIKLYNTFTFTPEGKRRTLGDAFNAEELSFVNDAQRMLATTASDVDSATARLGSRISRLESVRNMTHEENTRIEEFRSFEEDTDVAKATLEYKKAETALAYALQVGGRIISNSLFDFLR